HKIINGIPGKPPRPLCTPELFFSYWATKEVAQVAWNLRRLLIEKMDRPENMMVYPNDPMALMDFWKGDSLDAVDFIMGVEEFFQISIPEADAGNFFTKYSFYETVNYISKRVREK
ncbi:MAG: hypothetical protein R3Y28_08885, partial [Candidatus Gastranaerophilales bacterium]